MKKIKIYLSGAITGRKNYEEEFKEAKNKLKRFEKKHNEMANKEKIKLKIIVPCDYDHLNKTGKWEDYLKNDIPILLKCDCLIDIENESYNSKGCMLEKMICSSLGIPIISLNAFVNYNASYLYSTTNFNVSMSISKIGV